MYVKMNELLRWNNQSRIGTLQLSHQDSMELDAVK